MKKTAHFAHNHVQNEPFFIELLKSPANAGVRAVLLRSVSKLYLSALRHIWKTKKLIKFP